MTNRPLQPNKIRLFQQKILIIKLQYVGDTMGVIPVVALLKKHAPDLKVDVLIHQESAELIEYDAEIHKVWKYDLKKAKSNFFSTIAYNLSLISKLRREKYDIVIALTQGDRAFFLSYATGAPVRLTYKINSISSRLMNAFADQNNTRGHFIEIDADILSYFGIENREIRLMIPIPDGVRCNIRNQLNFRTDSEQMLVAIHPGARKPIRRWKPERYAQIASRLHEKYGTSVILLGGYREQHLLDEIESKMGFATTLKSCNLSLLEMAAIFSECRLFIGNDSGPGHIAAAVGCPTLSLFGPNYPSICRPYIASGEVIFKDLACCGCRQEENFCDRLEDTCMDLITVDEVWSIVQKMLEVK